MINRVPTCFIGDKHPHWRSLDRVYRLYKSTLVHHSLIDFRATRESDEPICTVFFRLSKTDIELLGYGGPAVVVLHGSCVLDRPLVLLIAQRLRECDALVVTCSSDAAILLSMILGNSPVIIILPLAAEVTPPRFTETGALLREMLELPPDTKTISMVGRLIPHKNAHVFLELLRGFASHPGVHGVLVGDYWDDYP